MQSHYFPLAEAIVTELATAAATQEQHNTASAGTANGRQTMPIPGAESLMSTGVGSAYMSQRRLCIAIAAHEVSSLEQVQSYIHDGADLNRSTTLGDIRDGQPLHWAAISGNSKAIEAVIASGELKDMNATYGDGFTPLALACGAQGREIHFPGKASPLLRDREREEEEMARNESVQILLHNGADPKLTDNQQRTALHHAAENNWSDLIATLLNYSGTLIDINARDKHGNTPLHKAASMGHYDSASLLLQFGADPNAVNKLQETPLHRLSLAHRSSPDDEASSCELAITLLDAGAKLDLLDRRHKHKLAGTPFDHAVQGRRYRLMNTLSDYSDKQAGKDRVQAKPYVPLAWHTLAKQSQASSPERQQPEGKESHESQQQASNPVHSPAGLFLPD